MRESSTRWFGPADRVLAAAPAAEQAAVALAAASGVHPADSPRMAARGVYLPGTVTRFRAPVTFRSTTATQPGDDHLVYVDVDLDGSDPVAVRMVDFLRSDEVPGPR